MHLTALILALDGESANADSTGLAAISIVSIVSGYLLLAALWYLVFSSKARARRREKSSGD
jgi:hypothetical protein